MPCGRVAEADAGASAAPFFPEGAFDAEDVSDGVIGGGSAEVNYFYFTSLPQERFSL
jgi:hypothetical protein